MLALTDSQLGMLAIAATAVTPSQRGRWLKQIANSSTAIEHGSRTPAASRAAERLRPRRRSRQIQTGSVGARLGRKSVREHQRLGAAVPIGRITLWVSTRTACPTHGYEPTREAAMAAFAKKLAAE